VLTKRSPTDPIDGTIHSAADHSVNAAAAYCVLRRADGPVARTHNLPAARRTWVYRDSTTSEPFRATTKIELYNRYFWSTEAAIKLAVGDWIERVYNHRRRHWATDVTARLSSRNRITRTAETPNPRPPNGVKLSRHKSSTALCPRFRFVLQGAWHQCDRRRCGCAAQRSVHIAEMIADPSAANLISRPAVGLTRLARLPRRTVAVEWPRLKLTH
jgi:hypothetical protein